MRVALLDTAGPNSAFVTVTTESAPSNMQYIPLIFDLDVFRDVQFLPHEAIIWETFASLRETRNMIFYNSITEETRRLFQ